MRVFLAVFPPPEAQAAAVAVIEALRWPGDGVSWVREQNLHFTLRFLGEIGADGLGRASEAAREAVAGRQSFDVALGAPGAFPSSARSRVLWLGLSSGSEELTALAQDLDLTLARRGFGHAARPFSPHLTLGRVRQPGRDWTAPLAAANSLETWAHARFTVRHIASVESTLSPRGSTYRVADEAPLEA
ncbi:MAG: RNA 2',3'-cyclic phosphodiesterase [Candidatus Eisenbacteria bacterium]|nr:RNA 2',3'-cyclic phosphodiesterase [Candidatus Eisenbacteria bacterium]